MGYIPLMLNVSDVDVLIIGGGEASWRRAGDFCRQGARVWQITADDCQEDQLAGIDRHTLSLSPQQFLQQPLADSFSNIQSIKHFRLPWYFKFSYLKFIKPMWWRQFLLIIPMSSETELNVGIAQAAGTANVLVNAATPAIRRSICREKDRVGDASVPGTICVELMAALRRGSLTIGIHSGGVPGLSRAIKQRVLTAVPQIWGEAADWLKACREELLLRELSPTKRRTIMRHLTKLVDEAEGDLTAAKAYWSDIDKIR